MRWISRNRAIDLVGPDVTCDLFFAEERSLLGTEEPGRPAFRKAPAGFVGPGLE